MFRGSRSRARIALFTALSALVPVAVTSTATPAQAASASVIGPLLSRAENPNTSWGRDGGYSVALPNGKVFWIFGDTPRYSFQNNKWQLTAFIYGSSAGIGPANGKPPKKPFTEVIPGRSLNGNNQPRQFLPTPRLYMPNGSGKICNKANGGPSAGAARWPTGAALMPDKTNILVPYIGVCVISASNYRAESWGFALFNWKTSRFTVAPVDVRPPAKSGVGLAASLFHGSPVIDGGKVTFFSSDCCHQASHTYTATVAAKVAALRKKSSYTLKIIPGLYPAPIQTVVRPSKSQPHLTMYQYVDSLGRYRLLKAKKPAGPWTLLGQGVLPKCNNKAPRQCVSVALHPWLSTSSKMLVTYYVPGYGPGIATKHPAPGGALGHVVMAYLPA
jgi:hypothetical protein